MMINKESFKMVTLVYIAVFIFIACFAFEMYSMQTHTLSRDEIAKKTIKRRYNQSLKKAIIARGGSYVEQYGFIREL